MTDSPRARGGFSAPPAAGGPLKIHGQFVGYTAMKWLYALAIGVCTALLAFVINLCVENGSAAKFRATLWVMDRSLFLSFAVYLLFNSAFVFCSAMLVAYIAPAAAGSGASRRALGALAGGAEPAVGRTARRPAAEGGATGGGGRSPPASSRG